MARRRNHGGPARTRSGCARHASARPGDACGKPCVRRRIRRGGGVDRGGRHDCRRDRTMHRCGTTRYRSAVWRGAEAEAMRLLEATTELAASRGEGRVTGLIGCMTAILNNGLGRYEEALRAAKAGVRTRGSRPVSDVPCRTHRGGLSAAASERRRLEAAARMESQAAAGTDWALGTLARCRALVADDDTAEDHYREAIDRLGRTRMRVYLARSHLVYGEWLRRDAPASGRTRTAGHRPRDVRPDGGGGFAERARRELLVTGEKTRKRTVGSGDGLTAQEAQIAAAGRHRADQPGDRRTAVHQRAHRRMAPAEGVRQARHQVTSPAPRPGQATEGHLSPRTTG